MSHGTQWLSHLQLRHPCRPRCAHLGQLSERGRKGPPARLGGLQVGRSPRTRDLYQGAAPLSSPSRHGRTRPSAGRLHGGFHRCEADAPALAAGRCRSRRAHQGHGFRGRRREPDASLGLVRHLDGRRRRRSRNGDVPRLSPLDGRLLRRLPEPARRRDPGRRPRHRGCARRNPPLGPVRAGPGA